MKHLDEVQEKYFKHLFEALLIVVSLLIAAGACFVHAIIPKIFTKTASTIMKNILNRTDERYAK
jgi:hypothetical protein